MKLEKITLENLKALMSNGDFGGLSAKIAKFVKAK